MEEIRYNDNGMMVSYDSWYENGQKKVEIRYNENGEIVSMIVGMIMGN